MSLHSGEMVEWQARESTCEEYGLQFVGYAKRTAGLPPAPAPAVRIEINQSTFRCCDIAQHTIR
eukprot:1194262-Prorocentrum_minimum.AAC.5